MSPMLQGLTVGAMGIAITFAALGLIILVIVALQHLFAQPPAAPSRDETGAIKMPEPPQEEEEVVAAISAALAYMRAAEPARGGLGSSLGVESGAWWHVGQAIQHAHGDALPKGKR